MDTYVEIRPTTLGGLLNSIAKETGKTLIRSIPQTIIIAAFAWVWHVYLLAVPNDGFRPDTPIGQFLATNTTGVIGTLIWMLGSTFIFAFFATIKQKGISGAITDVIRTPFDLLQYFKESGDAAYIVIFGGAGIALLTSSTVSSSLGYVVALGVSVAFTGYLGRFLAVFIQVTWNTIQTKFFPQHKQVQIGMAVSYVAMAGATLGFLLGYFYVGQTMLFGIICLGIAGYFLTQKNTPPAAKVLGMLFTLVGLYAVFGDVLRALADDGGLPEMNWKFTEWAGSEGGFRVFTQSIPPAIGAGIGGGVLGPTLVNIGQTLTNTPIGGGDVPPEAPLPPQIPPQEPPSVVPPEDPNEPLEDPNKYDKDGYDKDGYDKEGFDRNGYDKDGYNRKGFNKDGYDNEGYNTIGYDKDGYGRDGLNKAGYDCNGYDVHGYDSKGYDQYGYDKNGFDSEGYDVNGKDKKGYSKEDYDNKEKMKEAISKLKDLKVDDETKNKLIKAVSDAAQIDGNKIPHGNVDQINTMLDAQIRMSEDKPSSYWGDVAGNFATNVKNEVTELPGQVVDAAKKGYEVTSNAVSTVKDAVTDPTNWKGLNDAIGDTVKDLILHPIDSTLKVGNFYKTGTAKFGEVAGNLTAAVEQDPSILLEIGKGILGIDTWEKVMDPKVPLLNRIGNAIYGAVDTTLNITSGGTTKAIKGIDATHDVLKGVDATKDTFRAAEKTSDAMHTGDATKDGLKAAEGVETATDGDKALDATKPKHPQNDPDEALPPKDKDGDIPKEKDGKPVTEDDVKDAKAQAQKEKDARLAESEVKVKIKSFERALEKGDPDEIKRALLEIQRDPAAKQRLNLHDVVENADGTVKSRTFDVDDATRNAYKEAVGDIYKETDPKYLDKVKDRLQDADQFKKDFGVNLDGYDIQDVKVSTLSGEKPYVKIDADRDAATQLILKDKKTGEIITVEVPDHNGVLQKDYNEVFHETSGANKQYVGQTADQIGDKMEQTVIFGGHKEGFGDDAAKVLKGEPITPDQAEKVRDAIMNKSDKFSDASDALRAEGKGSAAIKAEGEAMRMTSKEADIVAKHAENISAQRVARGETPITIPDDIKQGVDIMGQVGQKVDGKIFTVADANKHLNQLGLSAKDVNRTIANTMTQLYPK